MLLHDAGIGLGENRCPARIANKLLGPLDHSVALAGLLHDNLAAAGHLESLLGAAFRLHFGHFALRWGRCANCAKARRTVALSILDRYGMPIQPGGGKARL